MVDTGSDLFRRGFDEAMRPQQDDGSRPGEQSLSSQEMWRRTYQSFHHGAGQSVLDLEANDPYRFASSKGIDPWTQGELTVLSDTEVVVADSTSTLDRAVVADGVLLSIRDTDVNSYDGTVWSDLTTLGSTPSTVATDGFRVYLGCADGKVKGMVAATGVTADDWTLANVDVLGFGKQRLFATVGPAIHLLVPATAAALHWTHPFAAWEWTAITEGSTAIYVAGKLGDKSSIYKITVDVDGLLEVPSVATNLPDGETVTGLGSYLGYIMVGTTKGVRFGAGDNDGNLTLGGVIPTPNPVRCFEPQDRFVWFGWSDYDDTSTGLGRMDLSEFTQTLVPAYASDLMLTGQGEVSSVVTYADRTWFTVDGDGLIMESDTPLAAGTIDLSTTDYGIVEDKAALFVELKHHTLSGSVEVWLERDALDFGSVGYSAVEGSTSASLRLSARIGSTFTVRLILTTNVLAPVVTSVMLRARPLMPRAKRFVMPLIVADTQELDGVSQERDSADDLSFLEDLVEAGIPTSMQMGIQAFTVFPSAGEFRPMKQTENKLAWSGTYILQLSEVT